MDAEPKKRPPHLEIELDALEHAADVARATGISEDSAIAGLVRMWRHCWRERVRAVPALAVRGFFGHDVSDALQTFGFLGEANATGFPVRGAPRLLRVIEARIRGGHAAKGNLVPGPKPKRDIGSSSAQPKGQPKGSRRAAEGPAEEQPKDFFGSPSALQPPSTRITTTSKEGAAAQSATPPHVQRRNVVSEKITAPNPRHHPIQVALMGAYRATTGCDYVLQGRDFKALARLAQGLLTEEEIVRRWLIALGSSGFDKPTDIFDFESKVNRYAVTAATQPTRGRASEADRDWNKPRVVEVDEQGQVLL